MDVNKVTMERDSYGHSVQSLRPVQTTSSNVSLSGASQRLALSQKAKLLRVASTGNCYIQFGDGTVEATTDSVLFPAGVEIFTKAHLWTHIAVLREGTSSGVFHVSEME